MHLKKSKLALAVATGLAFSSGAFATNGIIQAGNGMVAHGFGGAGLANSGEASAGMDNPALIGQTGNSLSLGFSMFSPDRKFSYYGTDFNSDAKMFAIPQIAYTSKINDNMSWGIMAYAMGGMNTSYRRDPTSWFNYGDARASSVDLSGMIVAPTLSFKVNNDITVGGSLLVGYETLRTRNLYGMESLANILASYYVLDIGTNEGSAVGFGVKLGLDWKIAKGIEVGAIIQPKMSMGEISFFKNFLNFVSGGTYAGDAQLTLPNTFGIGGKFAVGNNIDIVADVMQYQWTSVDVFDFFGWEDQTVIKVGAEFRTSENMALRVGYNYGKSPIQGNVAVSNYPFPAVSEQHVTVGLGYKMDKNMAINAYYLHSPEAKITQDGAPNLSISMSQNAFGLGINYQAK